MSLLYKILQRLLVYFLPLVVLLFSISLNLPNASLHKQTLQNTNFYNRFSSEIKKISAQPDGQTNFWSLFTKDFSNPVTLQSISEKNIDLTTDWLSQKSNDWTFYLPGQTQPNEQAEVSKELIEANKDKIPECTPENLESIKTSLSQGQTLDLQKNFCLPAQVKSGQISLDNFLAQNQLEKVAASAITNTTDGLKTMAVNAVGQNTYSFFSFLRQYLTRIRSTSPIVIAVMAGLLLVLTLLAGTIGRRPLSDLQSNLWHVGVAILSLSAVFILIFGGIALVNSWFGEFLFGQKSPEISTILTTQWLWFLFDLVSLAIWSGLGLVILTLTLKLLPQGSAQSRNEKLYKNQPKNLEEDLPPAYKAAKPNQAVSQDNYSNSASGRFDNFEADSEQIFNKNSDSFKEPSKNFKDLTSDSWPDNSSKDNHSNQTFDQEFQQETRPIRQPQPIKPNISGVILPHEQYEIPTQIPRNRPIPPRIHPKLSHPPKSDIATDLALAKSKNWQNLENTNNFVMVDSTEADDFADPADQNQMDQAQIKKHPVQDDSIESPSNPNDWEKNSLPKSNSVLDSNVNPYQ